MWKNGPKSIWGNAWDKFLNTGSWRHHHQQRLLKIHFTKWVQYFFITHNLIYRPLCFYFFACVDWMSCYRQLVKICVNSTLSKYIYSENWRHYQYLFYPVHVSLILYDQQIWFGKEVYEYIELYILEIFIFNSDFIIFYT